MCADNSRIYGKRRKRFYQTFLNFFPRFLRFLFLSERLQITSMAETVVVYRNSR